MTTKERNEYKKALKTWNSTCAMCNSRVVHLHHILGRRNHLTVKENLIPLCRYHHLDVVHKNETYYAEILLELNRGKYGIIDRQDLKKKNKWEEVFE